MSAQDKARGGKNKEKKGSKKRGKDRKRIWKKKGPGIIPSRSEECQKKKKKKKKREECPDLGSVSKGEEGNNVIPEGLTG